MKNQSLKKLALLGVLVASSAQATERRTPWISEHGPLRYTFEKLHEDAWNFNYWSAVHYKEAHKSFLKHSTKTVPYTALIFNKADFDLKEIFPNSQVPFDAEFYSPFLKLTHVSPRAEYTEVGMTVGGKIEFPVWCNKGRIGLRATVPFRRIEIERTDNCCDLDTNPLAPFVASKMIRIDRNSPATDVDAAAAAAAAAAGGAGNGNGGGDAALAAINVQNIGGTADQATANAMVLNAASIANAIDAVVPAGSTFAGAASGPLINATMPDVNNFFGANTAGPINLTDATAGQVVAAALATKAQGGALASAAGVQGAINAANNTLAINAVANRGNRAEGTAQTDMLVNAYRLDFVASLPDSQHNSALQIPNGTTVNLYGRDVAVAANQRNRATVGLARAVNADALQSAGFNAWMPAPTTDAPVGHIDVVNPANANTGIVAMANTLATLPITPGSSVNAAGVGYFDTAIDYQGLKDVVNGLTPAGLSQANSLWLTFRRAADSADPERFSRNELGTAGEGGAIARNIENQLRLFTQNPFAFFASKDFQLETGIRSGLGDIDLDLFYEHDFCDEWRGEVWVGVRFPTGQGKDQQNPYQPQLGNGEHWEVKIGGLMAWQPTCWMNIKIDGMYSFVLESSETRAAAFKGATIKNFGPAVQADVDWGYAVGHVDFTFFHPCTDKVRSMVGYEIYYKTEDHLSFKQKQAESWLGRKFDAAGNLVANPQDLDSGLARKNTEGIGHKVRWETSCQINKYFEIFGGGTCVFAGQNVTRDRDAHLGYNIRF